MELTCQGRSCLSWSVSLISPRADSWASSTEDGWGSTTTGTIPRAKLLLPALLQRHFPLCVSDCANPRANQQTWLVNGITWQTVTPIICLSQSHLPFPNCCSSRVWQGAPGVHRTGLGSGDHLSPFSMAIWNSGPHAQYTPSSHMGLVLTWVSHNLSWPKWKASLGSNHKPGAKRVRGWTGHQQAWPWGPTCLE